MINKIKLVLAALLLVAGLAGFYLLADKPTVLRILAVLAGLGASIAVLWTAPVGQRVLSFIGDAVVESRKVVWPTRKETIQTTLVVFVLVLVSFLLLLSLLMSSSSSSSSLLLLRGYGRGCGCCCFRRRRRRRRRHCCDGCCCCCCCWRWRSCWC